MVLISNSDSYFQDISGKFKENWSNYDGNWFPKYNVETLLVSVKKYLLNKTAMNLQKTGFIFKHCATKGS